MHLATKKLQQYGKIASSQRGKKSLQEKEELICKYAPLVKTIAGRLAMKLPQHVAQDDLLSAGTMGLLDAIEKYDSEKGVEFKSYAEFRIRGAMLDELRAMDWVPRSVRKNAKILEDAYAKIEKEKMRPAREEEVAERLGLEMEAFYQLLDSARGISIINQEEIGNLIPQSGTDDVGQINPASAATDPLRSLKLTEVRDIIAQGIEKLPKNEQTVVSLYYYEELTMKEIGKIMGYTESRISQLHTKAVLRLRTSLKEYFEL
jgi:RNA polymerase sigma factor for flagellar operon FliA